MSRQSYEIDGLRVATARQAITGQNGKPMTQAELAARADVHRVTITKIENGDANVSLDLLERLAGILDCTREHLLGAAEPIDPVEASRAKLADGLEEVADGFEKLSEVVDELTHEAQLAKATA